MNIRLPNQIFKELRILAASEDVPMSKICLGFVLAGLEKTKAKILTEAVERIKSSSD